MIFTAPELKCLGAVFVYNAVKESMIIWELEKSVDLLFQSIYAMMMTANEIACL